MALWTPYVVGQEAPLDLTKDSVNFKEYSPTPGMSPPPYCPVVPDYYHTHTDTELQYYSYQHQAGPPYAVPTLSPDSGSSWSYVKPSGSSASETEHFETESLSDDIEYQEFERDAMQAMAEKNGGTLLGNNPRMRRAVQTNEVADDSYRRQREKNNFAAKQSRDRRKLREVRLALQVSYLKKKMAILKSRLTSGVCNRCRQV